MNDGEQPIHPTQIGMKELLEAACKRVARQMSQEEWQLYMGNQPYRETCPGKPVLRRLS